MATMLTTEQAAVRLSEMRAISGKPGVVTSHAVRTYIRAGRLKAERNPNGQGYLINEEELDIRPRRSGRKKLVDRERWAAIRREVMVLCRSVPLVARAHLLDPVTVYRYLKNDGLRAPPSFVVDSEWVLIRQEIFDQGKTVAWSAKKHRYTLATVLKRLASEGLHAPRKPRPSRRQRTADAKRAAALAAVG